MNLTQETRFKCDFCGAVGSFALDTNMPMFNQLVICEKCLKEFYEAAGKILVPKSPENIILKREKSRKMREVAFDEKTED